MTILLENFVCYQQYSSRHHKRIRQLRAPSLLDSSGFVPLLLLPAPHQAGRDCSALCIVFVLVAVRFGLWTMMAELSFSVDDLYLFYFVGYQQHSSRHRKRIRQPRAPAVLDSSGLVPLLLPPAPRQAGRECSALCIVIVLLAVRFGLWTMMAELCFSFDDFI